MTEQLRVGRRRIEITRPNKPLWSRPRITKLELAQHYERVASSMLPHVKGRPLALQAFPRGIEHPGYFLKALPGHFPAWIDRVTVPKRGGTVTHVVANSAATLVYLAGQNIITPHVWPARGDKPRQPDRLIFDFDPSGDDFAAVRDAAREVGDRLTSAGLVAFAMTSGSRGIHVVAPLRRGPTFTQVHQFARALAEEVVRADPARLTLAWHRAERGSKIYVDVNRNNYAQHGVAAYAARPKPGAPVATPLHWEELTDPRLRPQAWTIANIADRLTALDDPWLGLSRHARSLPMRGPEEAAGPYRRSARIARRD